MSNETQINSILEILSKRKGLRSVEKDLILRQKLLSGRPVLDNNPLNVLNSLPARTSPKNLGDLSDVVWDFAIPITLDFEDDAKIPDGVFAPLIHRVEEEAGLVLVGLKRVCKSEAGIHLPMGISIRDGQSLTNFCDSQFPIQAIGNYQYPLLFDHPIIIAPKATLQIELKNIGGFDIQTEGNASQEILLYGFKGRNINSIHALMSAYN